MNNKYIGDKTTTNNYQHLVVVNVFKFSNNDDRQNELIVSFKSFVSVVVIPPKRGKCQSWI